MVSVYHVRKSQYRVAFQNSGVLVVAVRETILGNHPSQAGIPSE